MPMQKRPPIIVVLGHVDHGKTTLLDYIRKTSVASREPGGITQSVGAYEIEHPSTHSGQAQKITFIDTPGHQAFSKMRQRGAKAADLAILVVAADDGLKPQTEESIKILKEAKIPFVVAINKIDRQNADIERVKNQLAQAEVSLEGSGGDISWQAISAKTGGGVNELLDLILLAAEMENLEFDSSADGSGFIIESRRDKGEGITASVIVKNGILQTGRRIFTSSASGKVKALKNFKGENAESLEPSAPALIIGFDSLPEIGEEFKTGEEAAGSFKGKTEKARNIPLAGNGEEKTRLILKADDSGSLEALSEIILSSPSEKPVEILQKEVGDVNENDVNLAISGAALIIGFKVKTTQGGLNLAKAHRIKILTSDIIYELLQEFDKFVKGTADKHQNQLEILAVFGKKGKGQIIGGKVIKGAIAKNKPFILLRNEEEIAEGRIINLQRDKKDANEAKENQEAGLLVEIDVEIKIGDVLSQ